MKIKILPLLLISSVCAFYQNVLADEGGSQNGCHIDGSESVDAKIPLVATDLAPTNSQGFAKLESNNEDGNQTATLELKTVGLALGDYTVSVVLTSDGSTNVLGTFTVGGGDTEKKGGGGDHGDGEQGDGQQGDQGGNDNTNETVVTETQIVLPTTINSADIAQILISDASGNILLVGDTSAPVSASTIKFKAKVKLQAGPAAPAARGTAQLQVTSRKGKRLERFTLLGSGFPASTTLTVTVNGTQVSSVKSNRKGKLLINKLPAHHPNIRSVDLLDASGTISATAQF